MSFNLVIGLLIFSSFALADKPFEAPILKSKSSKELIVKKADLLRELHEKTTLQQCAEGTEFRRCSKLSKVECEKQFADADKTCGPEETKGISDELGDSYTKEQYGEIGAKVGKCSQSWLVDKNRAAFSKNCPEILKR